jgi:DNA-binding HxlR family transcriptional regulator
VKRTSLAHVNCSVARTLDVVGEWWTLLIVRNIMLGQRRFEAIHRDLGIARNILSDRLATLVANDIVEKRMYQDTPERFEYLLTQRGRDLFPVIAALMAWGDAWVSPDGAPLVFRHSCGADSQPIVVCSACGEPLDIGSVRARLGPGGTRRQARVGAAVDDPAE